MLLWVVINEVGILSRSYVVIEFWVFFVKKKGWVYICLCGVEIAKWWNAAAIWNCVIRFKFTWIICRLIIVDLSSRIQYLLVLRVWICVYSGYPCSKFVLRVSLRSNNPCNKGSTFLFEYKTICCQCLYSHRFQGFQNRFVYI